jgi:hypothetical protein
MEEGFVLELTEGSRRATEWIKGPPEKGFCFGVKIRRRERRQIRTFRCVKCGFLESYAI